MPDINSPDSNTAFQGWVNGRDNEGNHRERGAIIKDGPSVRKIVMVREYRHPESGDLKKRELRLRTHQRRAGSYDHDEADPKTSWWCQNEEVDRLVAFLNTAIDRTTRYRIVESESPTTALVELIQSADVDSETLAAAMSQYGDAAEIVKLLAATGPGFTAAQVAVATGRRRLLARLRTLIDAPNTTETDIQRLIGDEHWIFGGRYVGVARRSLLTLDQHDIPLIQANGTLHIIELKGSNVATLVRQHRNHFIVGDAIHEAVGQAMNYVRAFDEQGSTMATMYRNERNEDYDMRRIFATVVIGYPQHNTSRRADKREIDERTIEQTLRSYNSYLSRVEVITYRELLDTAERALAFEEGAATHSAPESANRPSWTPTLADDSSLVEALDFGNDPVSVDSVQPTGDPWGDEPPF